MDLLSHSGTQSRHASGNGVAVESSPPNGAVTPAGATDDSLTSLWARYDHFKLNDVFKNVFMEEVLTKYENLSRTHAKAMQDHEIEREYARTSMARERKLHDSVILLQNILNRDPFILVLLDGDGCIFRNTFMRDGEEGGKRAATLLHTAVTEWSLANVVDLPRDVKIVVRVYANIKGLANVLYKNGIIERPETLEDFARGFTRGKTLFDFVDVGYGKDRADGKMAEIFKLHLFDYHCRQIIFGCSHDNGYARLLEDYATNDQAKPRITLLEATPFEKELAVLPFNTTRFDSLFRNVKVTDGGPSDLMSDFRPRIDSRGLNAASGVFTPGSTPVVSPRGIPQLDGNQLGSYPFPSHLRSGSVASSGNSSESGIAGFSFAAAAQRAANLPLTLAISPPRKEAPAFPPVRRNKKGQRIDPVVSNYNREEVQRVKKIKMCNQYYLGGGCCHTSGNCAHTHEYKATKAEIETLKLVARESPCRNGVLCTDEQCIHGHRCPFPVATEGSMRGRGCLVGDNCRFPLEMHGIDMVPVKTLKVTGTL